jgi:hypothetical protein
VLSPGFVIAHSLSEGFSARNAPPQSPWGVSFSPKGGLWLASASNFSHRCHPHGLWSWSCYLVNFCSGGSGVSVSGKSYSCESSTSNFFRSRNSFTVSNKFLHRSRWLNVGPFTWALLNFSP